MIIGIVRGDDEGRPYQFTTAGQLITDFFAEVRRVLAENSSIPSFPG